MNINTNNLIEEGMRELEENKNIDLKAINKRICSKCIFNKVKNISEFDGDNKTCRNCLIKCREKVLCICGSRVSRSALSNHKLSKKHKNFELSN